MQNPPTRARDAVLDRYAAELLAHDTRLVAVRAEVRFRGGVAHVEGAAPDQERLDLLRSLLGRLAGVHAVWDRVRVPGQPRLRTVDIGAGGVKQHEENLGIDLLPLPAADVVADVSRRLPLRDGVVDRVYAVHVLEHFVDVMPVFQELWRVVAPYGVLHVMSPDWRHVNAVADPTHVRFFDVQTFKYFCRPRPGVALWHPLHVSADGASVFADLVPVKGPVGPAPPEALDRFFD